MADLLVAISRDGSHMSDLLQVVTHLLSLLADALDDSLDSLVDTTLHLHRVSTRGDVLETYVDDALSEYRSGSRTITSIFIGLRCHLTNELSTHILKLVL